ncbi:MAG: hypothetical protein SGI77_24260 [Pirellulaceae bacterium]|nr:hypothetical protein [Pirellulaceae bacterium]
MIETWETIWFWTLIIVLTVFGVLTIVVGIGGYFDVKTLLRSMNERHQDTDDLS